LKLSENKPPAPNDGVDSRGPDVIKLASLIKAYAPHDGSFELHISGVHAIRRSRTYTELVHGVQQSALCIVAQGEKSVMVGREVYEYNPSRIIVFSVDVPVASQVTRASLSEPFLCLRLDLDPQEIAKLVLKVFPQGLPPVHENGGVYIGQADANIVNAAIRLIELMAHPGDAELLAPLVIDEVLIRVLRSPIGVRVAQIGLANSGVYGVAKAVSWLRANFSQPMKVEELARLANMSVSSFHQHFRSVTSMSPLQYQKVLRLQEARRLLLSPMMDAGTASRRVGYISASQFSREYGGLAPISWTPFYATDSLSEFSSHSTGVV
jgi:AraC-like DNA-binding protein